MNRFYIKLFFILSFVLCLSCAKTVNDQILVLRLGAEPTFLNPILATDSASSSVNGYIFNGLLKVDSQMNLIPDLAKSYEVSEDKKTITFYLKENIFFHDGVKLTAEDVKFTYQTILDSKTNTVRRSDYIIDGTPIEFNVIDTYTIQLVLPKTFAPLLYSLTMGIIPKHIFEKEDINITQFNQNPIGTGPFKFSRWEPAQFVLLEKNENYFSIKKPKLESVLLKIIPDTNTALISFEKEEIYSCGLPPKDFARITKKDYINTFRYYDLGYTYLAFNFENRHFKNKNVRIALNQAINKQAIVDGILLGYAKEAHLPTSPEMWTYPESPFKYEYDMKRAKQILYSQGYRLNPKTNFLEKDGIPFEFKIITNKGNKDREKAATLIQKDLKELGINVSIQLMEWSSFIAILNDNTTPKAFDAVILGWGLGLDPDAYSIWHSSEYPRGFNFIGYKNDLVDRYLVQGRLELDRDKRRSVYQKMYTEISKDVGYVFLYYPESLIGINSRVKGLSPVGPAGLFNPIESIYLSEN